MSSSEPTITTLTETSDSQPTETPTQSDDPSHPQNTHENNSNNNPDVGQVVANPQSPKFSPGSRFAGASPKAASHKKPSSLPPKPQFASTGQHKPPRPSPRDGQAQPHAHTIGQASPGLGARRPSSLRAASPGGDGSASRSSSPIVGGSPLGAAPKGLKRTRPSSSSPALGSRGNSPAMIGGHGLMKFPAPPTGAGNNNDQQRHSLSSIKSLNQANRKSGTHAGHILNHHPPKPSSPPLPPPPKRSKGNYNSNNNANFNSQFNQGYNKNHEKRIDIEDGQPYTYASFIKVYGQRDGAERWKNSQRVSQGQPHLPPPPPPQPQHHNSGNRSSGSLQNSPNMNVTGLMPANSPSLPGSASQQQQQFVQVMQQPNTVQNMQVMSVPMMQMQQNTTVQQPDVNNVNQQQMMQQGQLMQLDDGQTVIQLPDGSIFQAMQLADGNIQIGAQLQMGLQMQMPVQVPQQPQVMMMQTSQQNTQNIPQSGSGGNNDTGGGTQQWQ